MSYIRPLSNAEGLYIIGSRGHDNEALVEFMGVPDWGGARRNDMFLHMPASVFEGLLTRWNRHHEDTAYKGASLLDLSTNDRYPVPTIDHDAWKVRLSYPEKWGAEGVNAYEVTWSYIATNIEKRRARREKAWWQ